MKKYIMLVSMAIVFANNVFSQQKYNDISELLQLLNTEEIIDKTIDKMVISVKHQAASELQDAEKLSAFMLYVNSQKRMLAKNLQETDLADMFANNFSDEEITELTKFCRTSAGQKFIALIPDIQKDMASKVISKYGPDLQERLENKLKEIKYGH